MMVPPEKSMPMVLVVPVPVGNGNRASGLASIADRPRSIASGH